MSVTNPIHGIIPRQSILGMENEWVKMFDPPTASPPTPELVLPTNPVPECMASSGSQITPGEAHGAERFLLENLILPTWDGAKQLVWFIFHDPENFEASGGIYPAQTTRVPRGSIFHGKSQGHGPPPHTIHWHGIEPTPMNDGVGHCSMEIGKYTFQWQPNFIGTYFYHCHRNTPQHFNYGLHGLLPIMPSDAFYATLWNPAIPIGAGRDVRFRTAANLSIIRGPTGGGVSMDAGNGSGFESSVIANPFPGWVGGLLTDPDPQANNPNLPSYLKFSTNPHAMTVPYDVEAIWVFLDRDSAWSETMPGARDTFPKYGNTPGSDDKFHEHLGINGTFALNQFNPDYWFVTGAPVPAHRGETGRIPNNIVIPPTLNSGVSGTQVSINARVGQTIFVRSLNGAYDVVDVTFPVDVVIIEWDGRALGVPPFGFNHPYLVPAGTPIHHSVARRFGALIRPTSPINGVVTAKFYSARHGGQAGTAPLAVTAEIPFIITAALPGSISGTVTNGSGSPLPGVTMALTGAATATAVTDLDGNYSIDNLADGSYTITPNRTGLAFTPSSLNITIAGAPAGGKNFVGETAAGTFSISGSVYDSVSGQPIAGVQVNLTGDRNGIAVTDNFGNYSFAGLVNGRYSVIPSHTGYSFSPRNRGATVKDANVIGRFFRGSKR
ncbi:MAG: carboxypeptidase regulatory-like domain-containing protein [Chloroflexi bacterium]|nr:carboxypeptidase regulatory-like domain-containing protein [Chloroflexota bacterium]